MPVLTPETDPFGKALLDHLDGDKDNAIVAHTAAADNDLIPVKYLFRDYEDMPEQEQLALQFCQGTVLEVGAGAGRHAAILQAAGHTVKCLDISPGAVQVMKKKGIDAELADIFDFNQGQYDTILMLMNGIGIVGTLDGLDRFLEHAKTLLTDGGQIIMDSTDVAYIYEEKGLSMNQNYYGEVTYRMEYGSIFGPVFPWLYVDLTTLSSYASRHGMTCDLLFENDEFTYLARLMRK